MIDHQLMVVISHAVSNHDFAWGGGVNGYFKYNLHSFLRNILEMKAI